MLVHGDKALKVKWTKKGKDGAVELTTVSGEPVSVPRGHTWIELRADHDRWRHAREVALAGPGNSAPESASWRSPASTMPITVSTWRPASSGWADSATDMPAAVIAP